MEELTPRMFSFNNPYGACPTCSGLGTQMRIDPDAGHPRPQPVAPAGRAARHGHGTSAADDSMFGMVL